MKLRSLANLILITSVILGTLFEFLFWQHGWGINFPIFIISIMAIGLWLAIREGHQIEGRHIGLITVVIFFAIVGLWRREPFGLLMSLGLSLSYLAILAASFSAGLWPKYGLLDYAEKIGLMPFRGLKIFADLRDHTKNSVNKKENRKNLGPIYRRLLLAIPVVFILGSLLASADYYFAEWVEGILIFLKLENLAELIGHVVRIFIVTIGLIAIYSFAIKGSQNEKLIWDGKALFAPFLGFQEAAIVLGSVILLLAVFVGIQFRYFFGGASNILISSFSYADYARRGFAELVAVAVITVLLFVVLSLLSERTKGREKKYFSGLGIGLFALVGVILLSAYQRLLLYESIFGFTRTRINAHVFMIILGIFFLALIALELTGHRKYFTLAFVLSLTVFGAGINLLNVDGFIVRANAQRSSERGLLDIPYLASLSTDAVPALIEEIKLSSPDDSQKLLAALACQALRLDDFLALGAWPSFHFSQHNARLAWMNFLDPSVQDRIEPVNDRNDFYEQISIDGEAFYCWDFVYYD